MRILAVSNLYPPDDIGGAERSVAITVDALRSRGHDVQVVTLSRRDATVDAVGVHRVRVQLPYDGFDGHQRRSSVRLLWHAAEALSRYHLGPLEQLCDSIDPDVVWTNGLAGLGIGVWRVAYSRKIPIAHTVRDYYLICPRSTMYRYDDACERQCMSCAALRFGVGPRSTEVESVVGTSRFILERHLAAGMFAGATAAVIGNPVDDAMLHMATKSRSVTHGGRVFGYLGQLTEPKGVIDLVEAFRAMGDGEATLRIAGSGSESLAREMQRHAREDRRISVVGRVDPTTFLLGIDVLVVPSRWPEPFGRVVIEAAALGVPAIVSNVGGLTELVTDEASGWTIPPSSPHALCKVMESIAWADIARKGEASRNVANAHTAADIAEEYERVFERLRLARRQA